VIIVLLFEIVSIVPKLRFLTLYDYNEAMLITFLLVMLAVTLVLFFLTRLAVERIERNHYLQRADLYRYVKIQKGDIVFLGDSITDGGCWDELSRI
jgi:hypothetical protein